jgi:small subunit ribosomal protein S6
LKNYEMIFIVHPNVPEEETPAVTDKVTSIINQHKGEVISLKKWGKKKLAHKIKKCTRGYFFLLHFLATPAVLAELERTLRYNENILRYQTVRAKKEEIEALRKEMEEQRQKEEGDSPPPLEETPAEKQEGG